MSDYVQVIESHLEPIYQEHCSIIEGYLSELPIGSYFQRLKSGYSVKVWRPLSEGSWLTITEDRLADAFEKAAKYLQEKENEISSV